MTTNVTLDELYNFFWKDYSSLSPDALKINAMLEARGERFFNDHVAFRTFNLDPIGLESLSAPFVELGYTPTGDYHFEQKKLRARSFKHDDPHIPHVFISELLVEEFSPTLQHAVAELVNQVPTALRGSHELFTSLPTWSPISFATYQKMLTESEYAGWLAAFGIRVNHFTVSINTLTTFESIYQFNDWLIENGFRLNSSGGLVKGTPEELLEQSSTMANQIEWEFANGERNSIPSCYYEFANRYPVPETGRLYDGFIARSADKIFESTDVSGR